MSEVLMLMLRLDSMVIRCRQLRWLAMILSHSCCLSLTLMLMLRADSLAMRCRRQHVITFARGENVHGEVRCRRLPQMVTGKWHNYSLTQAPMSTPKVERTGAHFKRQQQSPTRQSCDCYSTRALMST